MPISQVFVIGCERSGTTALTLLLASHYSIVVGMERYSGLYREAIRRHDAGALRPELFERDRFFAFDPAETRHIPPDTRFSALYEAAGQRFDTGLLRWTGDKVLPPDEWLMRTLAERFPLSRFLYISRDPVRVANSFEVRARNPDDLWPAANGFEVGIDHWNRAADGVRALSQQVGPGRLLELEAEQLFGPTIDVCHDALTFLDLDTWEGTDQTWEAHREAWTRLQSKDLVLTPPQVAAVRARATSARRAG